MLWSELRGVVAREVMRERIYKLERVIPPERPAPGQPRLAAESDLELVVEWTTAFVDEARVASGDARALMSEQVAGERVLLWDDAGPRCMAAAPAETPNGARISGVYTPPEWRGRGYASACVAALSRRVLDAGRRFCFLYTDLSNPTSNAIYQRIGYEPVGDVVDFRFVAPT